MIDSNLIGRNDFITEKTILLMSGPAKDEDKGALSFNSGTGTITLQGTGFSAQIKAGTIFKILNISTVEVDVAAMNAKIGTNTDPSGTTTLFARLRQIVDDYLASASTGMAAIKAVVDALELKLDDGTTGLAALKALIDAVEGKLDDGTYGLSVLKTLIDAVEGKLDNGTYGLSALKVLIDAIEAKLDSGTYGLNALKTLLDALETKLDRLRGSGKLGVAPGKFPEPLFIPLNGLRLEILSPTIMKELLDSQLCFHPSTSCMSINGTRMASLKERPAAPIWPWLVIS